MVVVGEWEQGDVVEPVRRVPVVGRAEVLVVGGGPAGIGAALAAARTGAKTTIVEHYGFLGGMWTAGLLNPILDHHGKGGIVAELVERFGYVHSGRTYVIADPREAWLFAVVRGRRWVARRVPDDRVVVLPNVHIIEEIDLEKVGRG